MRNLSIVIPCYNEAKNLSSVFKRLDSLNKKNSEVEIVLVDNGSEDETSNIIEEHLSARKKYIKLIRVEKNIGYGHGIMEGVRASSGDIIAWTHADLQTDPLDVLDAYKIISAHQNFPNCILKGRRVKRPLIDTLFTAGMSIISSTFLKVRLSDVNAQPKMFHKSFVSILKEPPKDFSLDLYLLYQARINNFPILELPVKYGNRIHGNAKGGGTLKGKFNLTMRTLDYLLRLKKDLNI